MNRSKHVVMSGAIGAAVSAAVVVTVYEGEVVFANDRGEVKLAPGDVASARAGEAPSAGVIGADPATLSRAELVDENRQLRAKLATLETSASEQAKAAQPWFVHEQRDEAWASAQEKLIAQRMQRFLRVRSKDAAIECRQRCCQIKMEQHAFGQINLELQSDVGFAAYANQWSIQSETDGDAGNTVATFCFDRDHDPSALPDRGIEREKLLASAAASLAECARQLATPLHGVIELTVDESGSVTDVDSKFVPVGAPAAQCVETAIVNAAVFAPSTRDTRVPIVIDLKPR